MKLPEKPDGMNDFEWRKINENWLEQRTEPPRNIEKRFIKGNPFLQAFAEETFQGLISCYQAYRKGDEAFFAQRRAGVPPSQEVREARIEAHRKTCLFVRDQGKLLQSGNEGCRSMNYEETRVFLGSIIKASIEAFALGTGYLPAVEKASLKNEEPSAGPGEWRR